MSDQSAGGGLGALLYKDPKVEPRAGLSGQPEVFCLPPLRGRRWRGDEQRERETDVGCGKRTWKCGERKEPLFLGLECLRNSLAWQHPGTLLIPRADSPTSLH